MQSRGPGPYSPAEMKTKTAYVFPQAVFGSSLYLHLTARGCASGPAPLAQAHSNLLPPIPAACAHPSRWHLPLLWPYSALPVPGLERPAPLLLPCSSQVTEFSRHAFSPHPCLTFSDFFRMFCLYLTVNNLLHSTSFSITPQPFTLLYFLYNTHTLTYYMCVYVCIQKYFGTFLFVNCLFVH